MRGKTLTEHELKALIEQFISSDKVITNPILWKSENHPDFIACRLPVIVPIEPRFNSVLILTAHLTKLPRKYCFTLLLGERVFGLDVNPARVHNNSAPRKMVSCTHWTAWPCKEVEPDDRDLTHKQWFRDFCVRTKITFSGAYHDPPYLSGEQGSFL